MENTLKQLYISNINLEIKELKDQQKKLLIAINISRDNLYKHFKTPRIHSSVENYAFDLLKKQRYELKDLYGFLCKKIKMLKDSKKQILK